MIIRKSREELILMQEAGRIVGATHTHLKSFLKPGITTKQLDKEAEKFILSQGATPSFKGYGGFKGSICTSINEVVVHGVPSHKDVLKDGDIISIDIGANYKGYHGDSAWSYPVGKISDEAQRLLDVTKQALFKGLEQVKPGNRIGDISFAIESFVRSHGFDLPRDYTGHGVGKDLHEDPIIPNFGVANRGPKIVEGMVFAVEPMVTQGKYFTKTLNDNWTVVTIDKKLAAHYEHTVAVTKDGYMILTKE